MKARAKKALADIKKKWPHAVMTVNNVLGAAIEAFSNDRPENDFYWEKTIKRIAKKFGGDAWNTGGGCIVGYILVDRNTWVGVTDECVVAYHTDKGVDSKTLNNKVLYKLAMEQDPAEQEFIAIDLWDAGRTSAKEG